MQGTILPAGEDETAGGILAGMTQTVRGLSLSVVSSQGECALLYTFPIGMDLLQLRDWEVKARKEKTGDSPEAAPALAPAGRGPLCFCGLGK